MFAIAFAAALAAAPQKGCPLPVIEDVTVARVTGGASFKLADGRHVKLAAVLVPQDMSVQAEQRLKAIVEGRAVELAFDKQVTDRHGALTPYVVAGSTWVQQALVSEGLARVRSSTNTSQCAAALIADEAGARKAKRGLWALPAYRLRNPDELEPEIGTFQIVEGKVLKVGRSKGRMFANFGPDHRTDFTVTIAPRDARRLAKEGIDPKTWTGKKIRVRGWISDLNGPEIELTHSAQIQILE